MKQIKMGAIILLICNLFTQCNFDTPTDVSIFNKITKDLVPVAGGTFKADTTFVTISSFKIDNCEITYELWTEVRNWGLVHGYTDLQQGQSGANSKTANNPVTCVNWYDVIKWCNARSEKDSLSVVYYTNSTQKTVYRTGNIDVINNAVMWTANGYRLPTECEWEFAARGGNQTHGYKYSGSDSWDEVAWCSNISDLKTHPVGNMNPNELGIYDMSGNVKEWCWDGYVANTYPSGGTVDPKGPSSSTFYHLLRGGSCFQADYECVVGRMSLWVTDRSERDIGNGFRCVRSR